MIWDCFIYNNETDILRVRFEELGDVVDRFVVVEATETFRGVEKPLHFDEQRDSLAKWEDKISRVTIDFPADITDPWERERIQRDAAMQGITDAAPDDIILISDADEIPRASIVERLPISNQVMQLDVVMYYMLFNWKVPDEWNQAGRPMASMKKNILSPHWHRNNPSGMRLSNGGWHFSYFGGVDFMRDKIESFSHSEYDSEEYKNREHLQYCMRNGCDPFGRFDLEHVPIDSTYPQWVQNNQYELDHLIRK